MFTSKAQHRIRSLEAQLEEQEAQLEEQEGVRLSLIARVNRLERDVEAARNEARDRERAQAPEVARLRE